MNRYRLLVNICRGTTAGEALRLMASGSQCSAETEHDGVELYQRYMDSAQFVLNAVDSKVLFGMCSLVDGETGKIILSESLMGKI